MLSLDSSIPGESASDTKTSLSDSNSGGEVALIPPMSFYWETPTMTAQKRTFISLSCFLKLDTVEVCVAAVRKKARQSDMLYAAWLDNQIHKGNDEVK